MLKATLEDNETKVRVVDNEKDIAFEFSHNPVNPRIWSVSVSPDEQFIATGGKDTTARIWDGQNYRNGQHILILTSDQTHGGSSNTGEYHTGYIWSVAFSPIHRLLVTIDFHFEIKLWQVGGLSPFGWRKLEDIGKFEAGKNRVYVRFSEDGTYIIAGNNEQSNEKTFALPNNLTLQNW